MFICDKDIKGNNTKKEIQECVGHISKEQESINDSMSSYFFESQLISLEPQLINQDKIISLEQIKGKLTSNCQALVLRTLPNLEDGLEEYN